MAVSQLSVLVHERYTYVCFLPVVRLLRRISVQENVKNRGLRMSELYSFRKKEQFQPRSKQSCVSEIAATACKTLVVTVIFWSSEATDLCKIYDRAVRMGSPLGKEGKSGF